MKAFKLIFLIGVFTLGFINTNQAQLLDTAMNGADFKVFPNPNQSDVDTYVSLKGFKADNLLVVVYDMLGREIYSKIQLIENDGFLFTLATNGQKLPAGIYLITASANDKVFHQKLIVNN
jgi:Secretion system C-terminal sorting domain